VLRPGFGDPLDEVGKAIPCIGIKLDSFFLWGRQPTLFALHAVESSTACPESHPVAALIRLSAVAVAGGVPKMLEFAETKPEPHWLDVQPPIDFHLTATGSLAIEFGTSAAGQIVRVGIEIPPERVLELRRGLEAAKTTQEMLAVKPPAQGAH
jgi:hypothetical protein